ncbi:MAG: DUF932 domain-containing protein [Neisseriaceae bacterium]|nr:MAG: DUF932 domain-containing protein [Neisseriaceae bacterium]
MTTQLVNSTVTPAWIEKPTSQEELLTNVQFFDFDNGIQLPSNLSSKYVAINTAKVVNSLLDYKFEDGTPMFQIRQVLRDGKRGKVTASNAYRHRVHLRTSKALKVAGNDTCYPEIVLFNSYDGTNALKVEMGLFRLVCSNGLTIKTTDFGSMKVNHIGEPAKIASDLVMDFIKAVPEIGKVYEALNTIKLNDTQIKEFGKAALEIKEMIYGSKSWSKKLSEQAEEVEIISEQLTKPRRKEDEGNGLWEVFNRVQENIIAGGVTIEKSETIKKARKMKGITHTGNAARVNAQLIDLAMSYVNNDSKQLSNDEVLIPTTIEEVALEAITQSLTEEKTVSSRYDNPKRITITLSDGTKKRVKNPNYIPSNDELVEI